MCLEYSSQFKSSAKNLIKGIFIRTICAEKLPLGSNFIKRGFLRISYLRTFQYDAKNQNKDAGNFPLRRKIKKIFC